MLTTSLLLFLLMFNMLLLCVYNFFTTCLLLFTRLLLLLCYMFTTCYYMFTTSLLHVCYFSFVLLHLNILLYFVTTSHFCYIFRTTFYYFCIFLRSDSASGTRTQQSLLLWFIILDLQDLLLPRFSVPSRGSQRLSRQRERGGPQGILPDPRGSSLGAPSLPRKSSENLEKVPRIWEVEGPGGPRQ